MIKLKGRPKANGALQVFAGQSRNGKRGADPPNGKAPCYGRSSGTCAANARAYNGSGQGQAQSGNENTDQHDNQRYPKGEFFVGPKAVLTDKRLGDLAVRVFCYALSKGRNYRLCVWHLREVFGKGEQAMGTAMKQLKEAGYARLDLQRGRGGKIVGSGYCIIRKPPLTETAVSRVSADPGLKEGKSLKKHQLKGANKLRKGSSASDEARSQLGSASQTRKKKERSPTWRLPYPQSRREMYATLIKLRIRPEPDFDCDYFGHQQVHGWRTDKGHRIKDWPQAYAAWSTKVLTDMHLEYEQDLDAAPLEDYELEAIEEASAAT